MNVTWTMNGSAGPPWAGGYGGVLPTSPIQVMWPWTTPLASIQAFTLIWLGERLGPFETSPCPRTLWAVATAGLKLHNTATAMPHIKSHLVKLRTQNMAISLVVCDGRKAKAAGAQTERRGLASRQMLAVGLAGEGSVCRLHPTGRFMLTSFHRSQAAINGACVFP
jgi:hypothetical protein